MKETARPNLVVSLLLCFLASMATKEGGDFVAIAAELHGTPAAAMRAGIVVEKEAAGGIVATANRGARPLDQEFGGGTSNSGEQPFEATFARNELEGPGAVTGDELVVTFGDA